MELLILSGLITLFVISILGVIFYGLWKIPKVGKVFGTSFLGFIAFTIVTAIWPMNSFYSDEIETYSKLKLPKDFKVLKKRSSYPDFHGDYFSEAVFYAPNLDLTNLAADLKKNQNCTIPKLVSSLIKTDFGTLECWDVTRKPDQWLRITYFRSINLLYYSFHQN